MAQNGPRFGLILTLAEVPSEVRRDIRPIMIPMTALERSRHSPPGHPGYLAPNNPAHSTNPTPDHLPQFLAGYELASSTTGVTRVSSKGVGPLSTPDPAIRYLIGVSGITQGPVMDRRQSNSKG
jgi:hypothetical protein